MASTTDTDYTYQIATFVLYNVARISTYDVVPATDGKEETKTLIVYPGVKRTVVNGVNEYTSDGKKVIFGDKPDTMPEGTVYDDGILETTTFMYIVTKTGDVGTMNCYFTTGDHNTTNIITDGKDGLSFNSTDKAAPVPMSEGYSWTKFGDFKPPSVRNKAASYLVRMNRDIKVYFNEEVCGANGDNVDSIPALKDSKILRLVMVI